MRTACRFNYLLLGVDESPVFCTQADKVDWESQVIHVVCDPGVGRQGIPLQPVVQHNNAVLQMHLHDISFVRKGEQPQHLTIIYLSYNYHITII